MSDGPSTPGGPRGTFESVHDPDTGILTLRFRGPLTAALALEALDRYSTESGGFAVRLRLWDLRDVEIRMSTAEIQSVGRLSQERDRQGGTSGRLALVVGGDLAYGLSRMHQVFRESDAIAQRIFRDEAEARAWLLTEEH